MTTEAKSTQESSPQLEWALRALVCLAKRCLKDANDSREDENEWPAGQEWRELSHTSQHSFMRRAREECGIPHKEWNDAMEKAVIEGGQDLVPVWEEFEKESTQ